MANGRTVAVVTGSRADYGLLRSVMRAIDKHPELELLTFVTGTHLLEPDPTSEEVAKNFQISCTITMQRPGETTRLADANALGRGISGLAEEFSKRKVDFVLVLGDRIEAFAAASAASVGGIHLVHMHGGDRAQGIADEAMRHAITKLAHIHLPASEQSAQRIVDLGEDPKRIHTVGSPAVDDLDDTPPLSDEKFNELGWPEIVYLLHPTGGDFDFEQDLAKRLMDLSQESGKVLALYPNHDPGREGILQVILESGCEYREHLPRKDFIGLLQRVRVIVGNSSAGLIECAALGVRCVNVGPRQAGRELCANVIDVPEAKSHQIFPAIARGLAYEIEPVKHPYGDGATGVRTANLLATLDMDQYPITKRNTF
ncbi:MAG: UDP-N-acetylglucosamine 2-epimerase (hydrolyzing) [Planctomycetes bacterium]|nr:UDP-N-acetylglucosamine 2-epimerase (hydrolyzing) [Planctomycetota bacterium]